MLVVQTRSLVAWSVIDQGAQDGTLAVALLPILGQVCRVRVSLCGENRISRGCEQEGA